MSGFSPDHRYFKVRGDQDASYILRNDVGPIVGN
jgi:hypothetical protein